MAGVEPVPGQAPQAQGQQGEKCGGQAERTQVPGLQLHRRDRAATADRAAGAGPVQGEGAGTDAAHGGDSLPQIVKALIRLPRSAGAATSASARRLGAAQPRRLDPAAAALYVWTQWKRGRDSLRRAATPRRRPGPGGANRRQPHRALGGSANSPALTMALPTPSSTRWACVRSPQHEPLNPTEPP